MTICKCPQCQNEFEAKSNDFGEALRCATCSHEWTLDTDHIARYRIPDLVHICLGDAHGNALPYRKIDVEYNFPILKVLTDSNGKAVVTAAMIAKAISDYVSRDGIMDHRYDEYDCQRYIHLRVDSARESIDLSENQKEVAVDMQA